MCGTTPPVTSGAVTSDPPEATQVTQHGPLPRRSSTPEPKLWHRRFPHQMFPRKSRRIGKGNAEAPHTGNCRVCFLNTQHSRPVCKLCNRDSITRRGSAHSSHRSPRRRGNHRVLEDPKTSPTEAPMSGTMAHARACKLCKTSLQACLHETHANTN